MPSGRLKQQCMASSKLCPALASSGVPSDRFDSGHNVLINAPQRMLASSMITSPDCVSGTSLRVHSQKPRCDGPRGVRRNTQQKCSTMRPIEAKMGRYRRLQPGMIAGAGHGLFEEHRLQHFGRHPNHHRAEFRSLLRWPGLLKLFRHFVLPILVPVLRAMLRVKTAWSCSLPLRAKAF